MGSNPTASAINLKEIIMSAPKQTASERDRTLSGQWTKTEKRSWAFRQIMDSKKRTYELLKAFKNAQILAK